MQLSKKEILFELRYVIHHIILLDRSTLLEILDRANEIEEIYTNFADNHYDENYTLVNFHNEHYVQIYHQFVSIEWGVDHIAYRPSGKGPSITNNRGTKIWFDADGKEIRRNDA